MPRSYRDFIIAFVVAWLVICIFILLINMNSTTSASAIEANGVGVYWDSKCSNRASSIEWGTLNPGSVKNVGVYIRNEVGKPVYLILSTANWNPSKASQYLNLGWNYSVRWMNPGEALRITLTLSVSRYIEGISSFSFDIIITGSDRLLGDVDGNGVVDMIDVSLACYAAFTTPGHPRWDPRCDINGDGQVTMYDIAVICMHFGEGMNP